MFIIFLLNIFNKNIIIIFKNIHKLNINILVYWDDMNHPEWNKVPFSIHAYTINSK